MQTIFPGPAEHDRTGKTNNMVTKEGYQYMTNAKQVEVIVETLGIPPRNSNRKWIMWRKV